MQHNDDAVIMKRLSNLAFVLTRMHLETRLSALVKVKLLHCVLLNYLHQNNHNHAVLYLLLHLCKQEIGVFLVLLIQLIRKKTWSWLLW